MMPKYYLYFNRYMLQRVRKKNNKVPILQFSFYLFIKADQIFYSNSLNVLTNHTFLTSYIVHLTMVFNSYTSSNHTKSKEWH